jgi:transcriptional regulator with XRE-family HTH domain
MDIRKSAIAQGLKDLRLQKEYTQEYVASILGAADGSAVYRLESGKAELKLEDAARLARLYEISIDQIYNPTDRGSRSGVSDQDRAPYGIKSKLQVSVFLDGTTVGLQKQVELLTKVNAALAEI